MLQQFKEVFCKELGTGQTPVHLNLKENSQPKCVSACPVEFAIKDTVTGENPEEG